MRYQNKGSETKDGDWLEDKLGDLFIGHEGTVDTEAFKATLRRNDVLLDSKWARQIDSDQNARINRAYAIGRTALEDKAIQHKLLHLPNGRGGWTRETVDEAWWALKFIGKAIRQRRKSEGLRLEDLSLLSGIESASISRIERGQRDAHLSTLTRLAAALNLDFQELFAGSTISSS